MRQNIYFLRTRHHDPHSQHRHTHTITGQRLQYLASSLKFTAGPLSADYDDASCYPWTDDEGRSYGQDVGLRGGSCSNRLNHRGVVSARPCEYKGGSFQSYQERLLAPLFWAPLNPPSCSQNQPPACGSRRRCFCYATPPQMCHTPPQLLSHASLALFVKLHTTHPSHLIRWGKGTGRVLLL